MVLGLSICNQAPFKEKKSILVPTQGQSCLLLFYTTKCLPQQHNWCHSLRFDQYNKARDEDQKEITQQTRPQEPWDILEKPTQQTDHPTESFEREERETDR